MGLARRATAERNSCVDNCFVPKGSMTHTRTLAYATSLLPSARQAKICFTVARIISAESESPRMMADAYARACSSVI